MTDVRFPALCAIGHDAKELADDIALVSHHRSAHSTTPLPDYKALLAPNPLGTVPTGGPRTTPKPAAAPATKSHENEYAEWGITETQMQEIDPDDVNSGGRYTKHEWADFMRELQTKHNVEVNGAKLILDLLVFVLVHKGTDKVGGLGDLNLHAADGTTEVTISWQTFKEDATEFWATRNKQFTMRRFIPTFQKLWWKMWNNPKIKALDDLRQEGTTSSRSIRIDGKSVPAWVVVVGLWDHHLDEAQLDARNTYIETTSRDAGTSAGQNPHKISYVGDNSARIGDFIQQSSRRLWNQAPIEFRRGGIGSEQQRPKTDWEKRLEEHTAQAST